MNPITLIPAYDRNIQSIIIELGVISLIKPGRKYYIRNGQLEMEPLSFSDFFMTKLGKEVKNPSLSYYTNFKRRIFGDSRESTINYIENIIQISIQNSKNLIKEKNSGDYRGDIHRESCLAYLTKKMNESIIGIKNLQKTYKNCERTIQKIEDIIEILKLQINENKKYYNICSSVTID